MNSFLSRLRGKPVPSSQLSAVDASPPADTAPREPAVPTGPAVTELDVRMCFRLLLGREPNPEEWSGHSAHVGGELGPVVAGYVNSLEFARRGLMRGDPARQPQMAEHPGFRIFADPDDPQIGRHVLAGAYEPEVAAVFRSVLEPGMAAIDIGANIGYFTMLAASLVGESGRVLAVEPNPANGRLLEASRRANGFGQVTVAQVAAGRRMGLLMLNTTHSNGTTAEPGEDQDGLLAANTVPSLALDTLVGAWWSGRIGLIKVDAEGAEYNALLGGTGTITRHRPVIVSEFSPDLMPGISGIDGPGYLQWLVGLGYAFSVIVPDGEPEAVGQDVGAVMAAYARRGNDHIDIIARPV